LDDLTDFVMQKIIIRTAKGMAQIFTRVLEEGHCRCKNFSERRRKFLKGGAKKCVLNDTWREREDIKSVT
jgi:hypothetical protein